MLPMFHMLLKATLVLGENKWGFKDLLKMSTKQPIKRITILCLLLSLVLLCGHVHHYSKDGAEQHCGLCAIINTGFILAATLWFELCYIILGILAFIDSTVVVNQTHFVYLMRAPPPAHPTGR